MEKSQIIATQRRIRVEPDGFWGPVSDAACKAYLRKIIDQSPNKWPKTDQASLTAFYGTPGDESRLINLPVPNGVYYDGEPVKTICCHEKVSESLDRIIRKLVKEWPNITAHYDGCYNNRKMRGGSLPSLHARGAAIDFMSSSNGNKDHWPVVADMPIGVMEIFAAEGWVSAGAFWNRDAMHSQASSL